MKKLILILVVMAMAAPLYAGREISFSFVDNWDGTCTITYDVNALDVAPVAMGLTVEVTSGAPVTGVICEDENDFLEIFMDSAYDMESDPCTPGYAYGDGTPIAKWDVAGEAQLALPWDPCDPFTVTANDGMKFAISMGGLGGQTDPEEKAPPRHGSITLSSDGGTEFKLYVNAVRGGIIGEDGEPLIALGLHDGGAKASHHRGRMSECYQEPDKNGVPKPGTSWYNSGKPVEWCFPRQCHGDADGRAEGNQWTGYYFVGNNDLNIMGAGWFTIGSPAKPNYDPPFGNGVNNLVHQGTGRRAGGADFKHNMQGNQWTGYYRIDNADLNEMGTYWLKKEGSGDEPPNTCIPASTEIHPCTELPGTYVPLVDEAVGGVCFGI